MELNLESGDTRQDPAREEVERALATLGSDDNGFAVLSRQGEFYIQAAGTRSRGFVVEYRNGSQDRHYQSRLTNIPHHQVVELFLSYFDGNDNWKHAIEWKNDTPRAAIKPASARYRRNAFILLVLGALLFLGSIVQLQATADVEKHLGVATGNIVALEKHFTRNSGIPRVDATVRFRANGREYTVQNSLDHDVFSVRVGNNVQVLYDARDPAAFTRFRESPTEIWREHYFLLITGVLMALCGGVYLVLANREAVRETRTGKS